MKIVFKLPKFPAFKRKREKMRATVARQPLRAATAADYEEMAEPNMKLSRALLIVLLLHVVAVSGIIAFNAIKTRQSPSLPRIKSISAHGPKSETAATSSSAGETGNGNTDEIRRAQPVTKDGTKQHGKAGNAGRRDDSHKTYIVARGDNPVSIAKKFKVSYDELLALNHIDDPRKLKIGQKLLIPAKNVKGKKSDE